MDKDYLIKLTLAVHQAGEWWPEGNLLKFRIRSLANKILADFILCSHKNPALKARERTAQNIHLLQQALEEVRSQKLITRKEFLLLQKEYEKVGKVIGSVVSASTSTREIEEQARPEILMPDSLNQRQRKILAFLEQRKKAQVWELKESFPNVSKRTLRRDLEGLRKRALVQRNGRWNKVFYTSFRKDRTG